MDYIGIMEKKMETTTLGLGIAGHKGIQYIGCL